MEQVLPGVWRWGDSAFGKTTDDGRPTTAQTGLGGSDRCGTAVRTSEGVVVIDPPPLPAEGRAALEREAGTVRFVVLTNEKHASLAEAFPGATVRVAGKDQLPGGLLPVWLPEDPSIHGEAAVLAPEVGAGLLVTGDAVPFVGQVPVYYEGDAPPMAVYQDALKALLAAEPGAIAPSRQAPPEARVVRATAWAAHIGSQLHRRRAAPVEGPRFLVPEGEKALMEALGAPVVLRRTSDRLRSDGGTAEEWVAEPFACARCGAPNEPMPQTCGGPVIARLCADCRAERRQELPSARVMVCEGGCCTRIGARAVASAARQALAAEGLLETVDVVPVTCLGECSIGPFVRVSRATGEELPAARAYRERTVERAQRFAEEEDEVVDEETELVLSRFAAQVQPAEMERLVKEMAGALRAVQSAKGKVQSEG